MYIDPQVRAYLDMLASSGEQPLQARSVEENRTSFLELTALSGDPQAVSSVDSRVIPGPESQIPIRIYSPNGNGPFPLLVYFHGGGWVFGNLDVHDSVCRALTNAAGCMTVAVDYRLAPEHKYPAAPEDCYAATRWVAENAGSYNGDPTRIAVGGDSAGGNLAAAVTL